MDHTPAEIMLRIAGRDEETRNLAYMTAVFQRMDRLPTIAQLDGRKRTAKDARKDYEELKRRRHGRKPR
ncbi:MAG: hypothetical protein A4E30_00754 [Methanomassiliicoccales archaeon PtaB.Bin215]|nr:MAG: hypothetical protein A4E30_00754 [Methanomassiliicoccales archaeon PtaB.Bin215]